MWLFKTRRMYFSKKLVLGTPPSYRNLFPGNSEKALKVLRVKFLFSGQRAVSAPSQHATGRMKRQWPCKGSATSRPARGRDLGVAVWGERWRGERGCSEKSTGSAVSQT